MNLGIAFLLYLEDRHRLHRAPACDVPLLALSKDPVEQSSRAEKADMTCVQRSNRSTTCPLLLRE
jgi:hypothetical protein